MILLKIILTLLIVFLMIFLISKKYNTVMILFSMSFFIMLIYTLYTGNSVLTENSSGNNIIDIFEYIVRDFSNQTVKIGILLMSVIGFIKYMEHIQAIDLLVQLISKPLKKIKRKRIIIVFTIFLVAVLKLFIPSHLGVVTLLMTFLYPILINIGIDNSTAVSAIVLGGAVDYGLSCPVTNYVISIDEISKYTNLLDFFIKYQIPIVFILLFVMSMIFILFNKSSSDSSIPKENMPTIENTENVPKIYALLPIIPLILVIVFSKFLVSNITISITAANFIGFALAFILNILYSKNKRHTFNDTKHFFDGMGSGFSSVVLIVSASVFAYSLTLIDGLSELFKIIANMKLGHFIAPIVASLTSFMTSVITGSGIAATYSIAPYVPNIAQTTRF